MNRSSENKMTTVPLLKKFTVDRAKWTGDNEYLINYFSQLYESENGRKCCIGFYASACGLYDSEISDIDDPEELFSHNNIHLTGFIDDVNYENNEFSSYAMQINDDTDISMEEKESKLIALFAEQGITLTFK